MPMIIDIPPRSGRLRPNDLTSYNIPLEQRATFFQTRCKVNHAFFCRECGNPAYDETQDPHRRGCFNCGYVTTQSEKHFEQRVTA